MGRRLRDVIRARFDRRAVVAGLPLLAAGLAASAAAPRTAIASTLGFREVAAAQDQTHHVSEGYGAQVLLRWGDPIVPEAPAFDPARQSAAAQLTQFGYNCDFIGFLPVPLGSEASDRGLLVVNHEYTDTRLMFPGLDQDDVEPSLGLVDTELAAHGLSVVEIVRDATGWRVVTDGFYNQRISTLATVVRIAGPASGHPRLVTKADPTGRRVLGTLANCGGGVTPWGTVLSGEENFDQYFSGAPGETPEARNYQRLGFGTSVYYPRWAHYSRRFDMGFEPNEPNRFGWVVEVDPFDPSAAPVKRTALGRFKHEAATPVVNGDGRVVVYMGDDEREEYVYKFVSAGTYDPVDRAASLELLDAGTLYVARFDEDGTVAWLPLVHGAGPLTEANDFASQADVVIEARRAADLLGATKMDRPEDVETNPVNGRVYVMLTKNSSREPDERDGANPRADNAFGHVLELTPPDGDHAADTARWDVFLLAGDGSNPAHKAQYGPGVGPDGWLANPDNCAFDATGRLWIATDGMAESMGAADGVFASDIDGAGRAATRRLFSVPKGAETCGPCFTPDATTLFVAVQHPGSGSRYASPSTRWPDFDPAMPPRPSVVAITRTDGGTIGG